MAPFSASGKAPGVFIDEVQVPGPIPGVGTSTAAFVGPAKRGPVNQPTFLTNLTQFEQVFGDFIFSPAVYVTHAVRGFFENGGTSCYFVRVGTAKRASLQLNTSSDRPTLVVTAKQEGRGKERMTVAVERSSIAENLTVQALANNQAELTLNSVQGIEPGSYVEISQGNTVETSVVESVNRAGNTITLGQPLSQDISLQATEGQPVPVAVRLKTLEFTLRIANPDPDSTLREQGSETFEKLALDPRHSRFFSKVVNSSNVDVAIASPPPTVLPPGNLPVALSATRLSGGGDDNLAELSSQTYVGALRQLEKIDEVNLVCIPDRTDLEVQKAMIAHCEKMQDRFAILDAQPNALSQPDTTPDSIGAQRNEISSDSGYGALYYPWISIAHPLGQGRILVPPSGHIAGVYARTDATRGVFKAPANEPLRSVLALERSLTDEEQGPLNDKGINVLRSFPGRGPVIWGARTIAPSDSTQWRYINVRRLLLFIEESLQEGTRFAVFEPNDLALWQKVKRQVTDFLTRVWQDGALFGASPDEAFRVRIDEELNPSVQRALGILTIEVVLFPVTPAEFVVFRVIQQPGGPTVQE